MTRIADFILYFSSVACSSRCFSVHMHGAVSIYKVFFFFFFQNASCNYILESKRNWTHATPSVCVCVFKCVSACMHVCDNVCVHVCACVYMLQVGVSHQVLRFILAYYFIQKSIDLA